MNKSPIVKEVKLSWLILVGITSLGVVISSITTFILVSRHQLNTSSELANAVPPASTKKTEPSGIAALGRIEPKGEIIHLAAPAFKEGARVEQLLVKQGSQVTPGQTIAILDSRDRLQGALEQAQTQVKVAQAQLEKVKAGAKNGTLTAQKATITRLQAELQGQIISQQATIERIQAEFKNAQIECRRYEMLLTDGVISASGKDAICLKEQTLQKQLAESIANRDRTVKTLQQQQAQARSTLEEIAEVRPVDLTIAQRELEETQANLQQAKANLALAYVKSPQVGQILKIHTFPGEIIKEKGIVQLGNTNQMYAVAEIYETDIHRVRLGQKATITSTGFTGTLSGNVDEIGLLVAKNDILGTDPAASDDVRVVEVKIGLNALASKQVKGLTNLQVNVVIHLDNQQK